MLIYACQSLSTVSILSAFWFWFPWRQFTILSWIANVTLRTSALWAVVDDETFGIRSAGILVKAGIHTLP